jgi:hypothetical protein
MDRIELSGKSQGKGRNGHFRLHSAEVIVVASDVDGQVAHVDFYSRRRLKSVGPARLLLTVDDAKRLAKFLDRTLGYCAPVAKVAEGALVCDCGFRGAPHLEE